MRVNRWASLALAAGTVTALTVTALPTAVQAAPPAGATINVTVGGDSAVNGVLFEGMRFLAPPTFSVHPGDTINFQFAGFHTATALPVGQSPDEWAAENVESPTAPYALIQPDDETGVFQFNPKDAFPSDPSCGTASSPCAYDGKTVVNSGAPIAANSFAMTVAASPGDVFWVICLIHPGMAMRVQVDAPTATTTTQAQVDGYAAAQLNADHEAAAALIPKLQKPSSHKTAAGKTVWDAFAGFDEDGWGLDGMFPSKLHIHKGQTVRWHFNQLMGNVHSVTFPKKQAGALNAVFGNPMCEGASADTPPDAAPPAFCSGGADKLELEIPGQAIAPAGNHTWGGSGFISSGVEGAGAPSNAPFDVKFTKTSSKTGFGYACIVHGTMMHGAVIVSS